MKFKTLSSKSLLVYTGFILFVSGGFMGYLYWGIEPQESIGGFLCGTGFILLLFYIIKKNK